MGIKWVLPTLVVIFSGNDLHAAESLSHPTVHFRHQLAPQFLNRNSVAILHPRETTASLSFEAVATSSRFDLSCRLVNADSGENVVPPFTSYGFWLGSVSSDPRNRYSLHESLTTPPASFPVGQHTISIIVSEEGSAWTNTAAVEIVSFGAALQELVSVTQATITNSAAKPTLRTLSGAQFSSNASRFRTVEINMRRFQRRLNRQSNLSEEVRNHLSYAAKRIRDVIRE